MLNPDVIETLSRSQFSLNTTLIDAPKGSIWIDDTEFSVEPKVMNVLVVLAAHPNKVIDQETLFDTVWPNAIFSPGSIRRCIAALRKLFDDAGIAGKSLIVTHPKKGYSLAANVTLMPERNQSDFAVTPSDIELKPSDIALKANDDVLRHDGAVPEPVQKGEANALEQAGFTTNQSAKNNPLNRKLRWILAIMAIVAIIAICVLVVSLSSIDETQSQFNIKELQPITATEHQEYNAKFSPDGTRIAFIRRHSPDFEFASLWVKSLKTEREYELYTDRVNNTNVEAYTWSPDGNKIVFTTRAMNNHPAKINKAGVTPYSSQLRSIDVTQLTPKNNLSTIVESNLNIKRVSSLHMAGDNQFYFLSSVNGAINLVSYTLENGAISTLWRFEDAFNPYELNFSHTHNSIALIGFNQDGISDLKSYDLQKKRVSDIASLNENRFFLSWHPTKQLVLLCDGRQLSTVSMTGVQSKIDFENFDFIRHAQFEPKGKGILLGLGKFDTDIKIVELANPQKTEKLIDTNTVDRAGSLSPDKSMLAFISHRKGYPQLYLQNMENNTTQLIYENADKLLGLSPPIWHPTENTIAFASYHFPILIKVDGNVIATEKLAQSSGAPVSWFTHSNALLTYNYLDNSYQKLNLDNKTSQTISFQAASLKSVSLQGFGGLLLEQNDHIIVRSENKILKGDLEGSEFNPIADINGRIDQMMLDGTALYILVSENKIKTVWQLDLVNFDKKELLTLPETLPGSTPEIISRISGIDDGSLYYEVTENEKNIVYLAIE